MRLSGKTDKGKDLRRIILRTTQGQKEAFDNFFRFLRSRYKNYGINEAYSRFNDALPKDCLEGISNMYQWRRTYLEPAANEAKNGDIRLPHHVIETGNPGFADLCKLCSKRTNCIKNR